MLPRAPLLLLALVFLASTPGRAMDILLFSRMNVSDQADYVTSLIEASTKLLRSEGHPDQAQRVIALFKDKSPKGGVTQLAQNLKDMSEQNIRNGDNPNRSLPVYTVESAMQLTLHRAGIEVPEKYLDGIDRHFTPFFPMH
jgi:hypothetical protein